MGYAYLESFAPIDRILTHALEAKHQVPLFWLAMFDATDLREERITGVRYASKEGLFAIESPYLISEAKVAHDRLRRRSAALATLCTPAHQPLLRKFVAYAKRLKPSLVMQLSYVAADAPGAFVTQLREALALVALLDDPKALPEQILIAPLTELSMPASWLEDANPTVLLSGWGWQVTPEERAQRTREKKWQKEVGDRPDSEQVPYAASREFQPGELLGHSTLGAGVVVRQVEGSKIEVLFRDGPRTLVHNRQAK